MSDPKIHLQELLACYGSDTSLWPEDKRAFGLHALKQPDLAALIRQEKHFEGRLALPAHEMSPLLTQRIITASFTRPQLNPALGLIYELFAEVRPAALAAMLVLGFAIGFGVSNVPPQTRDSLVMQAPSEDEGAIL